ncbi:HAMP domain-containing protein [bacterium]|nr:HAMP domain-containing protein [bacterium]
MRLKIWHKIMIGIAIPSFIAFMGGLLTYGYLNDVENREEYVLIADDLKEQIHEVRRNEKNFLHFKDKESLGHLSRALKKFDSMLNGISEKASEEMGNKEVAELKESCIAYPKTVGKLFESYTQEIRIIDSVREEGRKLESIIHTSSPSAELTTSFILHLRLLEKNYMIFRDRQTYQKLNEGIEMLRSTTPLCSDCTSYVQAIEMLFAIYDKSEQHVNALQVVGNKLEEVTKGIAVRERQRIRSFLAKSEQLTLMALILFASLSPLFVYKTAAKIVAPINRLADITRKIAEGDMQLRAPIREHDETYLLSTSINIMLDTLHLTHSSLERSMDLLKEKQAQLIESEKRASLGLLVSGVAHELNNPLNNISLITERLYDEREDMTPDEGKAFNNILYQCERAKHIVDSLLDFARARKSTVMEKQDLSRVILESFNLVNNQMKINKIALLTDIPDSPVYISGNRSKLEQILVSVYTNAIQAIKSNGTFKVELKVNEESRDAYIIMTDTGPGISEADMKNVFEPFFTTKSSAGTGLGLSVCHTLVKEHSGDIKVESILGSGTTFTIVLPLYDEVISG